MPAVQTNQYFYGNLAVASRTPDAHVLLDEDWRAWTAGAEQMLHLTAGCQHLRELRSAGEPVVEYTGNRLDELLDLAVPPRTHPLTCVCSSIERAMAGWDLRVEAAAAIADLETRTHGGDLDGDFKVLVSQQRLWLGYLWTLEHPEENPDPTLCDRFKRAYIRDALTPLDSSPRTGPREALLCFHTSAIPMDLLSLRQDRTERLIVTGTRQADIRDVCGRHDWSAHDDNVLALDHDDPGPSDALISAALNLWEPADNGALSSVEGALAAAALLDLDT